MILCCVCGKKLTKRQTRYVSEATYKDRGGRLKITTVPRPVCEQHEKEIRDGTVPTLSER